jgi:hypothetical protein
MAKVKKETCECGDSCSCSTSRSCGVCGGSIYGLGFLGAVIYYISTAGSFWMGVLGILKALVWPAFLVYELFKFLVA